MAQTYTLEEAADKLGMSTDELKRRLKDEWKAIRSFRDGPTLRFRAADIDELARTLGGASDPGLPLAPIAEEIGSDDFKIPGQVPKKSKPAEEPLHLDSGDDDIFSLSSSDSKVGKPKGKPDSDVRLESGKLKKGKKDEASVVPTEEINIDVGGPGSAVIKGGSSAKLSAPKSSSKLTSSSDSGKNKKLSNPSQGDSSEFELSLDADSDDFELQLNADTSDEVALGSMPKEKDPNKRGGESGINLRDPSDAGISLESGSGKKRKKPSKPDTDSSDDFDLSVEPAEGPKSMKLSNPKSGKAPKTSDSDSEFELTLDDSSGGSSLEHAALRDSGEKNDIFETDFEIPPMQDDSGSEAVAVEDTDLERSGEVELAFDDSDVLADEETGSQVVLIDEDEGKPAAKSGWRSGAKRPSADVEDLAGVELEEDDDDLASAAARRKRFRDAEEDEEEVAAGPARAANWGVFAPIVLALGLLFMLPGALMGYELLRTMWGYQQPRKPAAPIVNKLAETLDMPVKDQ